MDEEKKPKYKYARLSKERVEKAIREARGITVDAANILGCSRQNLLIFIRKHDMTPLLEECREIIVDRAESKLFDKIEAGDNWAIQYVLKTHGKARGYSDRQEIDVVSRNLNLEVDMDWDALPLEEKLRVEEAINRARRNQP